MGDVSARQQPPFELSGAVPQYDRNLQRHFLCGLLGYQIKLIPDEFATCSGQLSTDVRDGGVSVGQHFYDQIGSRMGSIPSSSKPEITDMELSELISAAAAIAGPLAQRVFEAGDTSPGRINQIAEAAVQIALRIEEEARKSYD